jgi:HSP20 family molecular chaperone IbpA
MSNLAVQHRRSLWPEITELFSGFPTLGARRPLLGNHVIKVEDAITDGRYELRAEIPGVNPEKDIDVTISRGVLTIKAQRSATTETDGHSEFSYGSFMRSVTLPADSEDEVKASYDKGILTVTVPLKVSEVPEKHVPIESTT